MESFNVFNLLIFSGIIHGLIFSVTVLVKKQYITNNTMYLALVVLFLSLSNLQYWFIDTKLTERFIWLSYCYIPMQWLILPMFYVYVCTFIKHRLSFHKKVLLCIPFIIVLLIILAQNPYRYFVNNNYNLPSHFEGGLYIYLELFSIGFNLLLMYLSYKAVVSYEKKDLNTIELVKPQTKWLKCLIYTGVIICFLWLIAIGVVLSLGVNTSVLFYPMWLIISLLIYYLGYVGLNKSLELKKRIELRAKRIEKAKKQKPIKVDENSALNTVLKLIIEEKLFLDSKLNLTKVAKKVNLSEGYISQLINSNSNTNFNDYINSLRVNEAKEMLSDLEFNNYTIESIGLEAGFNSKTNFYAVFKKHTNKTPFQYKKEVQDL